MRCQSIKRNINKVCTGDFRDRIAIQATSVTANNSPNGLSSVGFATVATVWALVKTNASRQYIDGVNIENGLNTDFYIRYNSAIPLDKELWVEYKNVLYKITNTDNIDKMDNIVRLRSSEKGSEDINANKR
jgi:SPP1 family predicted phage head-tail adaptor